MTANMQLSQSLSGNKLGQTYKVGGLAGRPATTRPRRQAPMTMAETNGASANGQVDLEENCAPQNARYLLAEGFRHGSCYGMDYR